MKTSLFVLVSCLLWGGLAYGRNVKKKSTRISRPIELQGSKENRIRQNLKANSLGINLILTTSELNVLINAQVLDELKENKVYYIDRGNYKVSKKKNCPTRDPRIFVWQHVRVYFEKLAADFFIANRRQLKVTSGTRSYEEQNLMRDKKSCYYTPYAAQAGSVLEESLHIRGLALDISRMVRLPGSNKEVSMSRKEILWLRNRLIEDKLKGVYFEVNGENIMTEVDPIEEKICYHIVVFPR